MAVTLTLVALLAVQAARLIWLLAIGPAPLGVANAEPMEAALPLAGLPDPFHPRDPNLATTADTSGLKLFGVRAQDTDAAAILADSDGNQGAYRIGDTIHPGVTLAAVASDHVVVRINGTSQRLAFTGAVDPGTATSASTTLPTALPPTSRPASDAPVTVDPQQLLSDAGLVPKVDGGQTTGYSVVPRGDGTALRQVGLQAGDVLLSVNGQALTPQRYRALAEELDGQQQITITYRRGGETRTATAQAKRP